MSLILKLARRKPLLFAQLVYERSFSKHVANREILDKFLINKTGIEIGGPSFFFSDKGYLPVYSIARHVDGCNFSSDTVWEGQIAEGNNYTYGNSKLGYQFICDGVDVPIVPKGKYDFVLSCNNLEHIANPLKAVRNWINLLKDGGCLILVLPRKESNFDHRRNVTLFQHLLDDDSNSVDEDDLTHLPEVLKLHDLKLDPLAGSFEDFEDRCKKNYLTRCLHHHVFDLALLTQICAFFNLGVDAAITRACEYVIIARKKMN